MKTLAAFALRLAGLVLFLPLAIPFMMSGLFTIIVVGVAFLVRGGDPEKTDRILLNPVICWADDLPLWLFEAAAKTQRHRA